MITAIPNVKAKMRLTGIKTPPVAFFPLRRRAGPPMFECRPDRPNLIAPWLPAGPSSRHLASHVLLETHSRWKFLRRWVAGRAGSTIQEFPRLIRHGEFVGQAHRNLQREILCNARQTSSDLDRHRQNSPVAIHLALLVGSCPAFAQNRSGLLF